MKTRGQRRWRFADEGKRNPSRIRKVVEYAVYSHMKEVSRYQNASVAARAVKAHPSGIHTACRNPSRKCNGYYWKYADKIIVPDDTWKSPLDFSNYLVTPAGQIFSTHLGRMLKQTKKGAYLACAVVTDGGKQVKRFVHRLVALAYLPNPTNKEQVNHKNGNKHDNQLVNLEWATRTENAQHALKTKLTSVEKPVVQKTLEGVLIKTYPSIKKAAASVDVTATSISRVCTRKSKICCGYLWAFKNCD